jgi:hypothetical protein
MPNKNIALFRRPKPMDATPHEANHAVWFALRHDPYSTQELVNRLCMPYEKIDRAVKQFQQLGFVRFDGVRYHTARPMGWSYDHDRQQWQHTPLTRPLIHQAAPCAA